MQAMPGAKRAFMIVGKRLGHYEVLSLLGSGGMGEVYRARDTRLEREVAIKVLPTSYASDADRLKRFEQEARSTSALNHPNIVTVYDIGTHEDSPYIVSELLAGSELRDQLDKGALLPRKAIDYAQQIVQGLAAAHEKGIIHRDLKPENLFVTSDGRVKILDFGLAKLRPLGNEVVSSEIATAKQITNPGTVIGTVGYMSPEQVRGENADHRSDIFSFGMILYEMLSGQRAFRRGSVAETMTAILREEPRALTQINPGISVNLEHIVTHCLEKRPEERFQSARDLGFSLGTLSTQSGSGSQGTDGTVANSDNTPLIFNREWLGWIIAGLFLIGLLASPLFVYLNKEPLRDARAARLSLLPPEKSSFDDVAISPDGRWLAFTAATGGKVQLWVRALDSTEANALAGTEGASYPFWSPDDRFIGYFAGNKLKKIEASGGLQTTLGDVRVGTGGSWSRDGVILFSSLGGVGLSRVSASGGEVTSVLKPDPRRQETDFTDPSFLPDGFHFLYSKSSPQKEVAGIYLASLDGKVNGRLLPDYSNAVYAAGANDKGYLLFGREGALMAQPFDSASRQLIGEPFLVTAQVGVTLGTIFNLRHRIFAVSDNGVLVVDQLPHRQRNQLMWVDRGGKQISSLDDLTNAAMLTLSPDGQRFVVPRLDLQTGNSNLWVADVSGQNAIRFTFDTAIDNYPIWSPDGSRIVWCSDREGIYQLYQKAASGAGQDTLVLKSDYYKFPTNWSRDGRYIIYREINPKTKFDVWVLPVGPEAGAQKPFPFLDTEANEAAAVLSPDERWMAYCSDESGQYEVYVQSFPEHGSKRQISTGGGIGPRWTSKELFYHALDGKLMAVEVKSGQSLEARAPLPLFEFRAGGNLITPYYDVTRDGQKFLLSTIVETEPAAPLTIMFNWTAAFKK